jgi:hypothetical protein
MDLGIVAGIIMLVVWAFVALHNGPGWIHLLLTLGMALIIWRIVVRGTKIGS